MSKRADRVWLRLSQWYGARWIEAFGPKPTEDWIRAVNGATDQQMQAALSAIRSKHLSHPPTLPEFEAALRIAQPKRTSSGEMSLIDRLEAAMARTPARGPRTWLARKNEAGQLVIYGLRSGATVITEDDLAMWESAA